MGMPSTILSDSYVLAHGYSILDMASRLKDKNGQLPRVLYVYLINPRRFKEAAYELKEDAIVRCSYLRPLFRIYLI